MEIISVVNQKGGVGKTTTVINLGATLAEKGKNILYVDLDPQANLTEGLGMLNEGKDTTYELIKGEADFVDIILPLDFKRDGWGKIGLIPADLRLANAELELSGEMGRELLLREAWNESKDKLTEKNYDYVLIDTNPSLGILTLNAVVLTDSVIIPVEPGIFSLSGMEKLVEVIGSVKKKFNPGLDVKGILLTRVDGRTNMAKNFYETYQGKFNDRVFDVLINQNVDLNEAQTKGLPVNIFNPQSKGAENYRKLAEVIENG